MNEYLIIGNNKKIIGTSSLKLDNCIQAHFKPFCLDIAKWDGKKLVYEFPIIKHKEVENHEDYTKIILTISAIYARTATYFSGNETREHNGNISVLIPCYKKSEYLMTAVKSCLKQTQKPTEVVVLLMDEDSYKLENDLLEMGITVYKESQMNVCKARTYLAEKCKTDWFIFLDADDFLLKNCIKELDKMNESFCMTKWVVMSNKEIDVEDWSGDAVDINKKECIIRQNMTALMHKDVFFDIGLKEEFANGGEDFDFLVRLCCKRKWSFSFNSTPLWVYRSDINESLTKKPAYYESYINVIKAHKEEIEKQLLDAEYFTRNDYQVLYFLNNPNKDSLRKLAVTSAFCHRNISRDKFYSEFDFLDDYISNEFEYWANESMKRDTNSVFNEDDYVAINCNDIKQVYLYNSQVKNSTFDAIIFNCDTNDVEKLITEPLSYVVRKDIQEEIEKKKLSNIDTLFYLLKNYSCFIRNENGEHFPRRFLSQEDELLVALGNIHFDKIAEESAQFIKETLTFGLFSTFKNKRSFHKRAITFILHKRCNANCKYCPQSDKSDPLTDDEIFANFDKALSKFEQELEEPFNVQVMGGETSLWSDYLQNKILERCKNYKYITIFTNGANKESPLYKSDKVIKNVHLLDWKNQIYNTPQKNERYDVLVDYDDDEGFEILNNYNGDTILHIVPIKSEQEKEPMFFKYLEKLADIDNGKIKNVHIVEFVNNIKSNGYEKTRELCRKGDKPCVEVDCTRMTVRPCSNSKFEYTFDEFDFSKLTPESECANCMFTY